MNKWYKIESVYYYGVIVKSTRCYLGGGVYADPDNPLYNLLGHLFIDQPHSLNAYSIFKVGDYGYHRFLTDAGDVNGIIPDDMSRYEIPESKVPEWCKDELGRS